MKLIKREILIVLLITISFISLNFTLYSQENNVWVFGKYGSLDFNYDPPRVLNPPPVLHTFQNCASVCDSMGKLLFYSDETNVYGADHQLYQNGTGINGVSYNGQGELVLPSASHYRRYFLFSVHFHYTVTNHGFYYSIIDEIKKEVISKNKQICRDTFFYLTAVRHANGKDVWLISRKYPDTFFVWLFSNDTLSKPQKFYIKNRFPPHYGFSGMRICPSNDGKLMIESGNFEVKIDDIKYNYANIASYDFSADSGIISNYRIILDTMFLYQGHSFHYYAGAFSPNDSLIYAISNTGQKNKSSVIQIHRNSKDVNLIYIHNTWPFENFNDLKTGPDGKIYLCYGNDSYVAVINYPDKFGNLCGLKEVYMRIAPGKTIWFAFPNNFFKLIRVNFDHIQNCDISPNLINLSDTSVFKKFTWYFPNGDSALGLHQYYDFGKSGKYYVRMKGVRDYGYTQWTSDTVDFFSKPSAIYFTDTSIGCQWLKFKFYDASVKDTVHPVLGESWLWDFGDGTTDTVQNPAHIYTKTGKYNVKLIYSNGFCSDTIEQSQSVEIIEAPKPGFIISDTNYCSPHTLTIADNSIGRVQSYLYDFGDSTFSTASSPSHFYGYPGEYKIKQTLTGTTGCITQDSAILHLRKGFDGSETVNSLTTNVMDNKSILVNWQSYPEAFSYDLYRAMSETGGYTKAANLTDTFFNDLSAEPMKKVFSYKIKGLDSCQRPGTESRLLKNIVLTGETYGNRYSILYWTPFEMWQNGVKEYVLEYRRSADTFEWINASTKNTYRDNDYFSGTKDFFKCYRIRAIEKDGNSQQSISNELCLEYEAILWIPNTFTPNGDGLNDSFNISGIRIADFNIKIYDRWGLQVFEGNDPENGWNGTCNGKNAPVDAYYYLITATGEGGRHIVLKGTVYVAR